MTEPERQRLAAILGMLGSAHAGERAAAALQAEALRRKLGLTWAELLATQDEPPAPPAQPAWTPPEPEPVHQPQQAPEAWVSPINWEPLGLMTLPYVGLAALFLLSCMFR
jgi:TorA maturation chaperone TorD